MAEGELVVRTLLSSDLGVHSVLVAENRVGPMADVFQGLTAPVFVASRGVVEKIVGFDMHRGVLAAGYRPPVPTLEQVCSQSRTLIVLEAMANHDNMGSLFRSAAALAGVDAVGFVLCPQCCDPLYRKAVRVSMGTALRVQWTTAENWPGCLDLIRNKGFTSYALTPGEEAADLRTLPRGERCAIVLGAEGPGLTEAAMAECDQRVRIGMDSGVDSLNVAVAGAIALSHFGGF